MQHSLHTCLPADLDALVDDLAAALSFIIFKATGTFNRVFKKYDDLNASVQENVGAIRVVKAFVREDYERSKFNKDVYKRQAPSHAESDAPSAL